MRITRLSVVGNLLLLALASALATSRAVAQQELVAWDLEPGLAQAHLVMVARVASISRVSVVEGAKTDVALREFRFQPVRRLRGLFQRDELSMTASDLGFEGSEATGAPPLREGEYRLLILVQQRGMETYGCVSMPPGANGFDERVPPLTGPDDPLVATVETLLQLADTRSRRERAGLVLDRLADAEGRAAVPLLASLLKRADWAAANERGYATAARLARDESPAVRGAALALLRGMLASRVAPAEREQVEAVGAALQGVLEADDNETAMRLAALAALADLLALTDDLQWPRELLIGELTGAATYAERTAAVAALAEIDHPDAAAAVLDALEALPLDEHPERALAIAAAARKVDRAGAERVLLARLERSLAARQPLQGVVVPLAKMRSAASVPLMLEAAARPEAGGNDHFYVAWSLGRLGDDRAAPVLAEWVRRGRQVDVALTALETLDSPAAAREARPLLRPQSQLQYKLRIARLLARHGMADGYALATEHLADIDHLPAATLVLAALDDPRTESDLSAIVAARPDRRWHAAALAGLAAVGDANARRDLGEILADDRHPLAADVAEAAGLAGDNELLRPLATLAQSRNRLLAKAALVALRRALGGVRSLPQGLAAAEWSAADLATSGERNEDGIFPPAAAVPAETRAAIAEAVAAIAADPYVDQELRGDAFAVARLAGGDGYAGLLAELADQAELEDDRRGLLTEVQTERRRLQSAGR